MFFVRLFDLRLFGLFISSSSWCLGRLRFVIVAFPELFSYLFSLYVMIKCLYSVMFLLYDVVSVLYAMIFPIYTVI